MEGELVEGLGDKYGDFGYGMGGQTLFYHMSKRLPGSLDLRVDTRRANL
jgi:hypothetical protein